MKRLRWKIRKTKNLSLRKISESLGYSKYSLSTLFSDYTLDRGKYVYKILDRAMRYANLDPDPGLLEPIGGKEDED